MSEHVASKELRELKEKIEKNEQIQLELREEYKELKEKIEKLETATERVLKIEQLVTRIANDVEVIKRKQDTELGVSISPCAFALFHLYYFAFALIY
jgi:hypothetical protein